MVFAQYLKYRTLHFYFDFSCWTHLLHSIAAVGKPLCFNEELMRPGYLNYFSAHFVPLVYILALPFKLLPYSETLIILNFLLMASSIIPLYKLALTRHKNTQFGLFMIALLLWYPTFQYTVLHGFEMLRFSIPIILWMLYFWEKRRMILYFVFVLLAILVREEVGLTIMMFGLYLLLIERKRRFGIITALIGLGAFVVIARVIMPALRTTGNYEHIAVGSFNAFGNTFGEIIINVVTHPVLTLSSILKPIKLANVFMFSLPLLFIPLLAPAVLISTLANFGVGMLSGSITHSSYMLYYLSPSIPFIFYAFVKGWSKLTKWLTRLSRNSLPGVRTDINSAAMMMVLSGLLVSNVFFGPSPISLQFWFKRLRPAPFRTQNFHHSTYKITEHHQKVEEFCKLIPDSAVVSAEQFLFPRLFKKKGTMIFPQMESYDGKVRAEYVFIDKSNPVKTGGGDKFYPGVWDGLRENPQFYYDLVEKDKENWQLIKSEDGYFLFKRKR